MTGLKIFNFNTLSIISLAALLYKNGIGSLIRNKRPNADTLSSSAIISKKLCSQEKKNSFDNNDIRRVC